MSAFSYSGRAQVNAISPNVEYHGEDKVLMIDLRLELLADTAVLEQLVPGLAALLYDGNKVQRAPDVTAIVLSSTFEPYALEIDGLAFQAVCVDKLKIEPAQNGTVSVHCTARLHGGENGDEIGGLHHLLREQVDLRLSPNQGQLL